MASAINVKHIGIRPSNVKAASVGSQKSFGVAMAGAEGMLGVANAAVGSSAPTASAVLAAAFGGINAAAGSMPMMAGGKMGMYGGGLGVPGMEGVTGVPGSSSNSVIAGTEGFTQWDMMSTMNQNNLQLLELQALMQSNMQAWNTKSNILNADHRVKTTMIEKLSPR